VNEDALAVVRRTLPAVRGLDFTGDVPVAALSREEIVATVAGEIEQSYAPGDIERLEAVYTRLGLLPAGTHSPVPSFKSCQERVQVRAERDPRGS